MTPQYTNGNGHTHLGRGKNGTQIGLSEVSIADNGQVIEPLQETFRKVERAKQEWESAVDALPELICVTDYDGRVVRANRTLEHWHLGSLVSVNGKSFHEVLHPNCPNPACYLETLLRQSLNSTLEQNPIQLNTFDAILGRHILIKIHAVAAKMDDSKPSAAIVVQDITQRKQMEEALHSYTNRLEVMNRIGEAILAANSPQEIARAAVSRMRLLVPFQRALLALSDPTSDNLLVIDVFAENSKERKLDRWLPTEALSHRNGPGLDVILLIEDLNELSNHSSLEEELLSDGIISYMSIPLIAQNSFAGAFILGSDRPGIFEDDHIKIADEVADLLAIATHQTGLNHRLEKANSSLQKALQSKEEMIQNVSHELRTPLSIIAGYANLMNEKAFGSLNEEQLEAMEILIGRLDQLEFLVSRLLTLQSLDENALQIEELQLQHFFCKMVESWKLRANTEGIDLHLNTAPDLTTLQADHNLLTLAVGTLVDNAVKFSPHGGNITISSWADTDEVYISVADEGIGIPVDKLETIFERFAQADGSTTRSFGGMGIGLALCHDIIDAHNGRIWAESEGQGTGSTFTMVLPSRQG